MMTCPHCYNTDVKKYGYRYNKGIATSRVYKCKRCNKRFSQLFENDESSEGLSAFVEKRPPKFRK